jgi:hypothetical protein
MTRGAHRNSMIDSWNDLATAGMPPEFFKLEGGRNFVDEPPINFNYIHRTCGRASTPYRIGLSARDIFMHPHRIDARCSAKHPSAVGNHGCFNTQTRPRDTPVALVAGRWLLALLAPGLGSSVGVPSTSDPLIR